MPRAQRKLAFVLAATDHGPMILNRFDYHALDANRVYGVGIELLQSGAFSPAEINLSLGLLDLRRRYFDDLAAYTEALLFGTLGLKKFSIYVQDYGAPVGYRIASRHQDAIESIVVQNGNAYVEGIGGAFDPMKPFWAHRSAETEKPVRRLLTKETTIFQYTHGVKDPESISPDSYTLDQLFLDRPGNDAIQLNLLHNYQSNVALYDGWHEYFRSKQPRMLIVWGKNDPFFTVDGARAYQRDIPNAQLHLLDTGHFALEDSFDFIAARIREFLR